MRVAILTGSSTTFDSRIRRIVGGLAGAGHHITLLSPDSRADFIGVAQHLPIAAVAQNRIALVRNLALMAPAAVIPSLALPLHRFSRFYRSALAALEQASPDIIHANDWVTLAAAQAWAKQSGVKRAGARVIYDSHEMASAEHMDRLWWRWLARPHVAAVERALIGTADHVVTVSDGLAAALAALYGARIRALSVIRNLPEQSLGRPAIMRSEATIKLAYAGLLRPERHIDVMIKAMGLLPAHYTLAITGFGPEGHVRELKELAEAQGVSARIIWHNPVPPDALVPHLAGTDIGLFLSDGASPQQRYALPNKVFEYMAAGAAVIASGSADVQAHLSATKAGLILERCTPQALAMAISDMPLGDMRLMQAAALQASAQHNWASEMQKLLDIYATLA